MNPIKEAIEALEEIYEQCEGYVPTTRRLRRSCASFLNTNGIKPNTQAGRKAIHSFWYGALVALDEPTNPWVTICLLSGRHDELVDFTKEPT